MDDLNILKWWHVSLVSSKNIIYPEASHTECVFPFSILLPILSLSSGRVPSFEGSGSWKQPGLPRIVGVGLRKGAPWPFVAKRVGGGGVGEKSTWNKYPLVIQHNVYIYTYRKRLFIVDLHLNMVIFHGYILVYLRVYEVGPNMDSSWWTTKKHEHLMGKWWPTREN